MTIFITLVKWWTGWERLTLSYNQPSAIFRQVVKFLGHVLTLQGLLPNPKQVTAVQSFPTPQNITELRQFLGLASYYHCFVVQFAKIASPLHWLTGKGVRWEWSQDCQKAFSELKQCLLNSSILAYQDFDDGLGTILSRGVPIWKFWQ